MCRDKLESVKPKGRAGEMCRYCRDKSVGRDKCAGVGRGKCVGTKMCRDVGQGKCVGTKVYGGANFAETKVYSDKSIGRVNV